MTKYFVLSIVALIFLLAAETHFNKPLWEWTEENAARLQQNTNRSLWKLISTLGLAVPMIMNAWEHYVNNPD